MSKTKNLPPVVQQALQAHLVAREARLDTISQIVTSKRQEAVQARKNSGIEEVWSKCEDAYVGLDDLNRSEFAGAKWIKPTSMSGPVTTGRGGQAASGSTVFIPLTSRYVDAGAAKLSEILLPVDDKAFSFEPTPVPELINGKDDQRQVVSDAGQPLMRDPKPEELAALQQPGAPAVDPAQGVPITVKDLAEEAMEQAKDAAKKAEKRVYDWMVESRYPAEMRKVIFDGARIGVGVLKAPYPEKRVAQAVTRTNGQVSLKTQRKTAPTARCISAWDLFPDPACGENVQDGDYIVERDYLSPKQVRKLIGLPGYIPSRIERVLVEGPGKRNTEDPSPDQAKTEHRFPVWYFYGVLNREDMEAMLEAGLLDAKTIMPEGAGEIAAIVTLINDTAVRASLNPLDSGCFPYHAFPWRRRAGSWAGVGVGEQITTPQRIVNAASRALLNNAGKSAGAQIVMDKGCIVPADKSWAITPDKLWFKNADSTLQDVRAAFATFDFPNMGTQLMAIIEYGFRLAEEASSIPLIAQGQTGPNTPDTYGAARLQNDNASQLLRSIGHTVDDFITEPVVNAYYEWLLLDPNVPDDEKGDWNINAHGSAALVERAIQDETIAQMGQMVMNPAFGVDPKKWFGEWMKSKRLDSRAFQYSEQEQAQLAQQPPPKAPVVQAAEVRAQSAEKIAQAKSQENVQLSKMDTDRDTAYVNAEAQKNQNEREIALQELAVKRELALLQYANQQKISLDTVKAQLTETAMKLQTQKDLGLAGLEADLHKHHNPPPVLTPPTEPAGRAPAGQAFAR